MEAPRPESESFHAGAVSRLTRSRPVRGLLATVRMLEEGAACGAELAAFVSPLHASLEECVGIIAGREDGER